MSLIIDSWFARLGDSKRYYNNSKRCNNKELLNGYAEKQKCWNLFKIEDN